MAHILQTGRLDLIPCSLAVAQAAISDKSQLETLLSIRVPDSWPTPDILGFFPVYAQMLAEAPSQLGWGVWLIIHAKERSLLGDLGFRGKPEGEDTVEMGYEVLPEYRNQGYAFEAVQALVEWANKQQGLQRIIAHCPEDNPASMRILAKLGMQRLEIVEMPDTPSLLMWKWELKLQ